MSDMEKIFSDFAKNVITKEDLFFFIDEINLAENLLFKEENISLSERLKGKVSETFENFIKYLEKEGVISENIENNRIFFEQLKNYLLKLPQIKFEIAFKTKGDFLNKLSFWLEKTLGKKLILDLYFNPEIVGGVIIEYQGKYFNFSLAKKIDELISKKSL